MVYKHNRKKTTKQNKINKKVAKTTNLIFLRCFVIFKRLCILFYTLFYLQKDKKATQNILQIFF